MTNKNQIIKVIKALIKEIERNTCEHESVHRGGLIWTICDDCGQRWADDRGGFEPYVRPKALEAADLLLKKLEESDEQERSVETPNRAAVLLDDMTQWGERQLAKHGSIGGPTSVEEWINNMTNYELLQELAGRGTWGNGN